MNDIDFARVAVQISDGGKNESEAEVVEISDRCEHTWTSGGSTCTDFAGYGRREGESGDSMVSFEVMMADVMASGSSVSFHQISGVQVGRWLYNSKVGDVRDVFSMWVCPSRLGVGCVRNRLFTLTWDPEWASFNEGEAEFWELFERMPVLDGNSYFLELDAARDKVYRKRARSRGHFYSKDATVQQIPLPHVMSPVVFSRLVEHLKQSPDDNTTFVCDLDQNWDWTSSGKKLPSFVTHAEIFSKQKGLMLHREMLQAQGEPVLAPSRYPCCIQPLLDLLLRRDCVAGPGKVETLNGNSMHAVAFGIWQLYCISSLELFTERRPWLAKTSGSGEIDGMDFAMS